MRKLLATLLGVGAAALPAVAIAAEVDNANDQKVTHHNGSELRSDASHAQKRAVYREQREELREERRKARERKLAKKRAASRGSTQAAAGGAGGGGASPALEAIAACESGSNPGAVGGGGAFRGKYQFDRGTWASVGGSGDPAAASEAEQDQRAAMLYARAGATPWPNCGQ